MELFTLDHDKSAHMKKKRHHYVPKAYLNFFCDEEGKVYVYRKDNPDKMIRQSPDNVGFHKYYYSQPLPEGGRDHNTLEDHFAELEAQWPPIVERLQQRENVNDSLESIFEFIALQRARVPASRDAFEKMLAEKVKAFARRLDAMGKLPPKPKGFDDLLDHVEVAIDPHRSAHAMVQMIAGMSQVFDPIGICVAHNTTEIPFLTSDNPVIWFDPSVPQEEMRPYHLQRGGPIMLLFPVAPDLLIYGDTTMRESFTHNGLEHSDLSDCGHVNEINRQVCRFAYKTVFAQRPGQEPLVRGNAELSPVLRTDVLPDNEGQYVIHQHIFGKREKKPKWGG